MILVTAECACKTGEEYPDGSKPEWYTKIKKVVERMAYHHDNASLFWGIHYKGVHVMNAFDDKGISLGRMTKSCEIENNVPWLTYVNK